ncbi:MAG TPA: hypothetical protein VF054_06850 [Micromonosporaceae bacterium]
MAAAEKAFHAAMVDVYHDAKRRAGYNAGYFLRMVSELGALGAARQLLHAGHVSEGFTKLWEKGRLDLSVEAVVLRDQFAVLFTDDERRIARQRLAEYGYRPDV